MRREELTALRDALSLALALPESVLGLLAQWLRDDASPGLSQAVSKSNGHDAHPSSAAPEPVKAKAERSAKPSPGSAKTAEKRLLAAMQDRPNLSAGALARVSGVARSTTQERLRRLEARGAIERTGEGWRIVREEARPTPPP